MANDRRTILWIVGMRDNACRERIASTLEALTGVKHVDVNLLRFQASIIHGAECRPQDLVQALTKAGYTCRLADPIEPDSAERKAD